MNKFILSAFGDEIADDLKTQMDVLERYGINHIEMRGVNGKPLVQYTLEEVRNIKAELDKRGFKISSIGSPIGKIKITDDFRPHLELFRHTLELTRILETGYIRMFSFFIPEGEKPKSYRKEVLERWRHFIAAAEVYEVVLLHENEKDIYGDTPERCLDLLTTLDCSFVKAVFDPANFVQCGYKAYPDAYGILKGHIAYMHIKDALYKDNSVVPAGYGDGMIREILTGLKSQGYEGFLSLEPHLASFTGLAELEHNSKITAIQKNSQDTFDIAYKALSKILVNVAHS